MARNGIELLGLARVSLSRYRFLLPTLVLLVAAIYLHLGGRVHTDTKEVTKEDTKLNIQNDFNYINGLVPDAAAYSRLIQELRDRLASGTQVHGIPVTRPLETIHRDDRFIRVELENNSEEVITVIINTVNAYVMGYYVGTASRPTLHYFRFDVNDQTTRQQLLEAFPEPPYNHSELDFGGGYPDLGERLRETTQLGHGALNAAIHELFNGYPRKKAAMLVIIQMLSEAVRIRYLEHVIRRDMLGDNDNFIPDARARSIENEWGSLSGQIQGASSSAELFHTEVVITSVSYQLIHIRNVLNAMRQAALALMLSRRCNPRYVIGMPVPVSVGAEEPCPIVEPATNIVGRDGKCMDVSNNNYTNGNSIILYKCTNYATRNQLWTFESDGTIRSNGKCLTTSGYSPYSYIMINDCHTANRDTTEWKLYNGGTIMNPISCLVIGAQSSTDGTGLKVDVEYNVSSQAWTAGNYTQPPINYISGLSEMCLQANGLDSNVSLANCVIGTETRQQWAFYGDNTIRPFNDSTRCVKSNGYSMLDSIVLGLCDGWGSVRWTFMADGTILHPFTGLVMDVKKSDVSLQEVILYRPTGNPNQKWLAF